MKRSWRHVILHILFGIHSPSLLAMGQCWCQRKGVEVPPMTQDELNEAIRLAAERAYRGWGE